MPGSSAVADSPTFVVGPPPFNQLAADITLRTSDHVDFHVHTPILAQASPVFADMFSLPQPPPDVPNAGSTHIRPIVDITEDSKTLERLLRLCYPINKQNLGELDDIVPVLKAATKYEMEWPISLLMNDLLAVAPNSPLKVWAVACQTGLEEVAHRAACAMRENAADTTQCLLALDALFQEEGLSVLDGINAGNYYRLREFLRSTIANQSFKLLTRSIWSLSSTFLSGFLSSLPLHPSSAPTTTPTAPATSPSVTTRRSRGSPRVFPVPSNPTPDLILKCADGRQLRAHQLMLSLQSAPLQAQVEAARDHASADIVSPTGSPTLIRSTSLPAIDLAVDSRTLTTLLGVLYEGEDRLPVNLPDVAAILLAARAYEMARLVRMIEGCWEAQATHNPLNAYFVAVQHGLEDFARAAARKVLGKPLAGWYVPSMEDSPVLAYHRLLVYYNTCARVVTERLDKAVDNWASTTANVATHRTQPYSGGYNISIPSQSWMNSYLQGLKAKVLSEGPGRTWEVTTEELLSQACSSNQSVWPSGNRAPCGIGWQCDTRSCRAR